MARPADHEIVYSAEGPRARGLAAMRAGFADLDHHRELLWLFIQRDIRVRYRQSFLGYLWAVAPPLAIALLFSLLAHYRALPMGALPVPYLAFALLNLAIWGLFTATLASATDSLVRAGALVTKTVFPKELIVLACAGPTLFDFCIRLIPAIIVFLYLTVGVSLVGVLLLPVMLIPILLLALGFGMLLSLGNLVFRDIGHAVGMTLTFGMFLTPVLYPPPVTYPFLLVNFLNPLSPLLIGIQDVLYRGTLGQPMVWALYAAGSTVLFVVAWRVFRLVLPRLAERA